MTFRGVRGNDELRKSSVLQRISCVLAVALLFCATAKAKPLSIAIVPGNSSMQPMIAAVKQVKEREKGLEDVRFHILPTGLEDHHKKILAESDAALVHNMGREISAAVTEPVRQMARRGAKAFAVGASFEEGERQAGLTRDEDLRAYSQQGGVENFAAMIKRLLARDFGFDFDVGPPKEFPREGLWNPRTGVLYERFEDYAADYLKARPEGRGRVWVGILFYRNTAQNGNSPLMLSLMDALEKRGMNVLPAFGYPPDALLRNVLFSPEGKPRVAATVSFVFKMGGDPKKTTAALQELDAPTINVISLQNQTREEWEASPLGLNLSERTWQVAIPELVGAIAPTVVAVKESRRDEASGFEYIVEVPVEERVDRVADRIRKWVSLRYELNQNKRVAIIYYNYPPGKENIGASYLNVLPKSLWRILTRLEQEKYTTTGRPESEDALFDLVRDHGVNMNSLTPGALEKMVRGGR
ncbi:MAG: cobaltochelatase subunit CobN, partial [Candidatus Accumulibacter sp.]|nr:cobaltochelatase subunit CobN [Accumulibacter sp.]